MLGLGLFSSLQDHSEERGCGFGPGAAAVTYRQRFKKSQHDDYFCLCNGR